MQYRGRELGGNGEAEGGQCSCGEVVGDEGRDFLARILEQAVCVVEVTS